MAARSGPSLPAAAPGGGWGGVVEYPRGASGALVAAWARPWADCWTGPGAVLGRGPAALHKDRRPPSPGRSTPTRCGAEARTLARIARRPRPGYRYLATAPCSAATPAE